MPSPKNSTRRPARPPTRGTRAAPARRAPTRKARRSWFWRYRRVLFLVVVLGGTALAGAVFVMFQSPLPSSPSVATLNQTSFLTDAAGRRLATFHGAENRTVVPMSRVPVVLRRAVVATEDRKFYRHSGVDPLGILRATVADLRHRGVRQGGSTITQQYVKNAYVGRERSAWRKLREAVIAVKIERRYSKDEILERYLNTIYFGRGAYGVQAAAQAYFGKDVEQLGLPESGLLAGLIRSPQTADPAVDPALAQTRRRLTLASMERDGYVTAGERRAADAVPLVGAGAIVLPRAELTRRTQVAQADKGTQYFVEYVRRYLVARYGEKAVYGGGLHVKTTLDLETQAQAYDAVYGFLDRRRDPAGALVAMDSEGSVRAMVGGRDWAQSKVNLAVRGNGSGGRQAGSTFKVFALAEAVRQGFTVESALPAPSQLVFPKADQGRDWKPRNYESESFDRLNLIEATAKSVNTVYAQLMMQLGPDKVVTLAHEMGIDAPLRAVPSLVLGTQNVSPLEMAEAYTTLANRGVHVDPQVVLEVTDADGDRIETFHPRRRRVLERQQADVVNYVLRQVVERGTGTGAALDRPVAGKTGTTQDYGDAWFVGYTPTLATAVWMGYPEGQSHKMLSVHGKKVSGGTWPALLFKRFMVAALRGVDSGDFATVTRFPGKVLKGVRVRNDPSSGTSPPTAHGATPRNSATSTPRDRGSDGSMPPATVAGPAPTSAPPSTSPSSTSPPPSSSPTTRLASPSPAP